jgi:hypothetical protein
MEDRSRVEAVRNDPGRECVKGTVETALCAMGDREMRFKTRFYRERQAAERIFSDAQEEDIMGWVRYCGQGELLVIES